MIAPQPRTRRVTVSQFSLRRIQAYAYFDRCRLDGGKLPAHLARFNDFLGIPPSP